MHWLARFGLWVARWGGWTPCTHPDTVPADEYARVLDEALALDTTVRQREAAWAASEQRADRLQAVMDATEARYRDMVRLYERQTSEITAIVAERDQARADFQTYAQQRLDIRPDLRVRAEYLVGLLHQRGRHLSGEFKRHQVYADLIKEFPETPKRDLSLAIEMAVRVKT